MQRWLIASSLVLLGACGLLEPSIESTMVSGTVYKAGVPVEGVVVDLLGGFEPPFARPTWTGSDTTDAEGRYSVSPSTPRPESCEGGGVVEISGAARASRRLYTTSSGPIRREIECGASQHGVDFHFASDLWYGPVSQDHNGSSERDTLLIPLQSRFHISASFEVSATPIDGYVHADSVEWVWGRTPHFSWQFDRELLIDHTEYGGDTYDGTFIDLYAREIGTTPVIATLEGSPFSDTILVKVEPTPQLE